MKITVAVNGRFWHFDLAAQLSKRDFLGRLITSYPAFKAYEWGIPYKQIRSLLPTELLNRSIKYFSETLSDGLTVFQKEWFDKWAMINIPTDTDIFVGLSSNCLHCIRKAKSNGSKTIVERGSSHMLFQMQILREEYEKYSLTPRLAPEKVIEKELCEYEEADYISIPSLFVKRSFLEKGIPEEKLIHNPYGVDLTHFKPVQKEDKVFRVVHCGSSSLRKGVHYLLQAFYELKLPNSELWLVGGMADEIKPFLKKYDNGKVFHKGHQPQNELYRYYSQCSVFCLASIEEGLAMVQPQAMACGLPMICTTNTGGEDIVRDGIDGFIIPIRNVEALKEKILFMYENPERCREMGKSARERVQSGFTWDDYGERMVQAYKRVLA